MIQIVSPHIDDAFLSIGGLIHRLTGGDRIQVVYVFSISNWTNPDNLAGISPGNDTSIVTEIRKREEEQLRRMAGHECRFLDLLDGPLRPCHDPVAEEALCRGLENTLTDIFGEEDACFFPVCDLHPDHGIVNRVGRSLLARGYPVCFYEDLPYMAFAKCNHRQLLDRLCGDGFIPQLLPVDMDRKLAALMTYKSQISEEWLNYVKTYGYNLPDNKYYERIWKPSSYSVDFTLK